MQNLSSGKVVNLSSTSNSEKKFDGVMISKPKSMESINPMNKVVGITSRPSLNSIAPFLPGRQPGLSGAH